MTKRNNRYLQMRKVMSFVLLGDLAVFILYLVGAALGIVWLKTATSIISILVSLLSLGYLFLTQEIFKKRSLWMTVAAAASLFCILYSLALNYPAPAPIPENIHIEI